MKTSFTNLFQTPEVTEEKPDYTSLKKSLDEKLESGVINQELHKSAGEELDFLEKASTAEEGEVIMLKGLNYVKVDGNFEPIVLGE